MKFYPKPLMAGEPGHGGVFYGESKTIPWSSTGASVHYLLLLCSPNQASQIVFSLAVLQFCVSASVQKINVTSLAGRPLPLLLGKLKQCLAGFNS